MPDTSLSMNISYLRSRHDRLWRICFRGDNGAAVLSDRGYTELDQAKADLERFLDYVSQNCGITVERERIQ